MKTPLELRPVHHRLEERIRAHVILCWLAGWLALLLVRIVETTTGDTWNRVREDLQELHVGTFEGPTGTFQQRTELTTAQTRTRGLPNAWASSPSAPRAIPAGPVAPSSRERLLPRTGRPGPPGLPTTGATLVTGDRTARTAAAVGHEETRPGPSQVSPCTVAFTEPGRRAARREELGSDGGSGMAVRACRRERLIGSLACPVVAGCWTMVFLSNEI